MKALIRRNRAVCELYCDGLNVGISNVSHPGNNDSFSGREVMPAESFPVRASFDFVKSYSSANRPVSANITPSDGGMPTQRKGIPGCDWLWHWQGCSSCSSDGRIMRSWSAMFASLTCFTQTYMLVVIVAMQNFKSFTVQQAKLLKMEHTDIQGSIHKEHKEIPPEPCGGRGGGHAC